MVRRPFLKRVGGTFVLAGLAWLVACAVGVPTPEEGTPQHGAAHYLTPDAKFCSSAPSLVYRGGPVLQNVRVYSVNWGSHINATVTGQMPLFYADVVASPYFDWLSEYNTVGLNGSDGQPGSNQGIARGSFAGSVTISPLLCAGTGSPNSCALTDTQVRAEINAQIAAGFLPAPTKGCDGWNDTVYMLNFDSSVQVTLAGVGGTCAELCAYHSTGVYQGLDYAYGVIPDYFAGACMGSNCGPNTPLENTTMIASHELVESVTDPEVGLAATPTSRPGAWHDATCGEVGDICEHLYGTINPSGTTWTVQQMWSNAVNDCIVTKPSLPAVCTAANTPAGCRPCACADDNRAAAGVPGCGGATPYCETDGTCAVAADAGVDSGSPGIDAGSVDAGVDSGSPGTDAGSVDAGVDSGAPGSDASAPRDAGLNEDAAAAAPEASADDAGSASPAQSSGCSCRTAERGTSPRSALLGLGALAMIGLVRRRRRAPCAHSQWPSM